MTIPWKLGRVQMDPIGALPFQLVTRLNMAGLHIKNARCKKYDIYIYILYCTVNIYMYILYIKNNSKICQRMLRCTEIC